MHVPAGVVPTEGIVERVRALLAGQVEPAPTRDAATVVLLRDAGPGVGGVEAYLLRRVRGMAFAGGAYVFPGGSVDPADAAAEIAWSGPPASWWAEQLLCDEPLARALVCAAVRETFEEAGVLLAGPSAHEVLADVSTDEWEAERVALETREQSLSELLARRGLVLRADLLHPLAHWITPEAEPKRFDTRFFVAALPSGQVCREAGTEADLRTWVRPGDDLSALPMLPPTARSLERVAQVPDVAAALALPFDPAPICPVFALSQDGTAILTVPGSQEPRRA